jgi:hypothetical protein
VESEDAAWAMSSVTPARGIACSLANRSLMCSTAVSAAAGRTAGIVDRNVKAAEALAREVHGPLGIGLACTSSPPRYSPSLNRTWILGTIPGRFSQS